MSFWHLLKWLTSTFKMVLLSLSWVKLEKDLFLIEKWSKDFRSTHCWWEEYKSFINLFCVHTILQKLQESTGRQWKQNQDVACMTWTCNRMRLIKTPIISFTPPKCLWNGKIQGDYIESLWSTWSSKVGLRMGMRSAVWKCCDVPMAKPFIHPPLPRF